MKASEFIPEYNIDPNELHRAAYLQRAVDKYNSKYQNKKPAMSNPNSPDAVTGEPGDGSEKGFGKNFASGFKNKLANPYDSNDLDKAIDVGGKVDDWIKAISDPSKRSVDAIK